MIANDLSWEEIHTGDAASFEHTITDADVASFALLSGDENPLHTDEAYAQGTQFGKRVVHGMLLGALCSRFVGMYIPGKRCLYLSQKIAFKKPVYIGDEISLTGTVVAKSESTRILTIAIVIRRGDDIVAEGEAQTKVL